MSDPESTVPSYIKAIIANPPPPGPGLYMLSVFHDDDCPKLQKGGGVCTCDAELGQPVKVQPQDDAVVAR